MTFRDYSYVLFSDEALIGMARGNDQPFLKEVLEYLSLNHLFAIPDQIGRPFGKGIELIVKSFEIEMGELAKAMLLYDARFEFHNRQTLTKTPEGFHEGLQVSMEKSTVNGKHEYHVTLRKGRANVLLYL